MSEQNYTLDNISTFVTLPVDTFDSDTLQRSEPLRIIKNAIIKKLPDGSLCIIDANEVYFAILSLLFIFSDIRIISVNFHLIFG